ncbi:IS3 family transposase [Streptococcus thoraltensis]
MKQEQDKSDIIFYNETRIQRKLNDLSPIEYRKQISK